MALKNTRDPSFFPFSFSLFLKMTKMILRHCIESLERQLGLAVAEREELMNEITERKKREEREQHLQRNPEHLSVAKLPHEVTEPSKDAAWLRIEEEKRRTFVPLADPERAILLSFLKDEKAEPLPTGLRLNHQALDFWVTMSELIEERHPDDLLVRATVQVNSISNAVFASLGSWNDENKKEFRANFVPLLLMLLERVKDLNDPVITGRQVQSLKEIPSVLEEMVPVVFQEQDEQGKKKMVLRIQDMLKLLVLLDPQRRLKGEVGTMLSKFQPVYASYLRSKIVNYL